jgi:aquaporin Z
VVAQTHRVQQRTSSALQALSRHWPEYMMEAWGLGTFMVSAGLFATLFEYPGSPVHQALPDPVARRILIGLAMGLTAVAIIYSPWGKRSGAHLNPATTLTFFSLGKVAPWDALFYIVAQFVGATLGILLVAALLGAAFTMAPVAYVATQPGAAGAAVAFAAEFTMSCGMMLMVLLVTNSERRAKYTGVFAGALVTIYIGIEAPLSGMSMNPARSFASAAPSGIWEGIWIYLTAPVAGMAMAPLLYRMFDARRRVHCAKLIHSEDQRCIHCHYQPLATKGRA